MKITRQSLWSGKTHTMDLPITPEQIGAWRNGMVIQRAMPHLTVSQREFLISGMTEQEWTDMCGSNEEER